MYRSSKYWFVYQEKSHFVLKVPVVQMSNSLVVTKFDLEKIVEGWRKGSFYSLLYNNRAWKRDNEIY